MLSGSLTTLYGGTYLYLSTSCSITFNAPSIGEASNFFRALRIWEARGDNRWSLAMLLLEHQIDWPLWHANHIKAFESRESVHDRYDPWQDAGEFDAVSENPPLDFKSIYKALHKAGRNVACKYATISWHSRQIIDKATYPADDLLSYEELQRLEVWSLTATASRAPLSTLLNVAKSSDFADCFARLKIPRAKNKSIASKYIDDHGHEGGVDAAFRANPRWANMLLLKAPANLLWDEYQAFRYIMKVMALDFYAYLSGDKFFERYAMDNGK